ncbi:sulfite exporter TauE/SafE family protein [candidate division KSB1 bacterium]|nr:sulfite exporter TauE/SafE family protein [candidate division KSB1 bacterium]
MHCEPSLFLLAVIGIMAGILSGLFGIGGGIIIVPALVYIVGFSQLSATGTSLAILLPPVGLAAVMEYYYHGHVHFRSAIVIAICLFLSAWASAHFANKINQFYLRIGFGVFMVLVGIMIVIVNWNRLGK